MSEVNGNLTGSTQNNYMSSAFNMKNFDWKGAALTGYGMLYNSIPTPHSDLNSSNLESANLRSGISNGLLSAGLLTGNPYVAAAGVAYGVIDKTGGFNDASMSLDSTSNTLNKIGSIALPGAGWFLGSTDRYTRSNASKQMASGYLGFDSFANKVELDSGGKFLVGSSKINLNVAKANMMDSSILNIKANRDNDFSAMYSMTLNIGTGNQFALNGGYNALYAVAAKSGTKFNADWAKKILKGSKGLVFNSYDPIQPKQKTSNDTVFQVKTNEPLEVTNPDLDKLMQDISNILGKYTSKLEAPREAPKPASNAEDNTLNTDQNKTEKPLLNSTTPVKPNEGMINTLTATPIENNGITWNVQNVTSLEEPYSQNVKNFFINTALNNGYEINGDTLVVPYNFEEVIKDTDFINATRRAGFKTLKFNKKSSSFKDGGVFEFEASDESLYLKEGGTFNVIPEGALHKNKHHMEDAEGLTKKGIPVVTEENGKYVQLAEIEKEEIIFNLLVTEDLEKLLKEYLNSDNEELKDSLAIEAGKLLTKEILHNTKDMTGLIKEC